jgi:putative DNA primase/helicase
VKEDSIMGRVKESMQENSAITSQPKRAASRRREPKQEPSHDSLEAPVQNVSPQPASASLASRRIVGDPLFELATVPNEIKALAQHRFGADIRMGTPRENGGPYRGEVFNTETYLIQEVATRSVVFHAKENLAFVSERLKWCDANQRLNGADLQIGYDGDRPQAYPWDRVRDQLVRTVASLKKSAKELGMAEEVGQTLDTLQAKSWERVKEARSVALAQRERQASERTVKSADGPDR